MNLRARVARYRLPLGNSVRTARAGWHERSGLTITLESDRGDFGQGEAAPLPGYSDDSLEQAETALSGLDLGWLEAQLGKLEAHPRSWLGALAESPTSDVPSAHFALETAVLDWLARRQRMPVHRWLRGALPELTQDPLPSLPLSALLGGDPLADARAALEQGFLSAKVKVGLPGRASAEFAELTALRTHFPELALRLDANGAWSTSEAAARLSEFAGLGVDFIEEPTAPHQTALVNPAISIALDESLRHTPLPTRSVLAARGVVACVLKPSILGISRCLTLSAEARALGCEPVLSHCFEGPIGFAALCELALALGPARFAPGLAPHVALESWAQKPAASLSRAALVPHDEPGLGLGRAPIEAPALP